MKTRTKVVLRSVGVTTIAVLAAVQIPTSAHANGIEPQDDQASELSSVEYTTKCEDRVGLVLIEATPGVCGYEPDPDYEGQRDFPTGSGSAPQHACTVSTSCSLSLYDSRSINPPGSTWNRGWIRASGVSDADLDSRWYTWPVPCIVEYDSNNTYVEWSGSGSVTELTHTIRWRTDKIGAGLTISHPPGANFSASSQTVTFEKTRNYATGDYQNLDTVRMENCGTGRITGVNLFVGGHFQFGSYGYSVNDSHGHGAA